MKKILKLKISNKKFLLTLFFLFLLIVSLRIGKFFWDSRNISQQKISIMTQNNYVSNGAGNIIIELSKLGNSEITYSGTRLLSEPIDKGEVKLRLENEKGEKISDLGENKIINGSLNMNFQLPNLPAEKYSLVLDISSKYGKDTLKKTITIQNEKKIVITTDSPLYKPGQSMNYRALILDKLTLKPIGQQDITITISDPGNNKLFRKSLKSSNYGIVSGNFSFAEELAFGEYKIIAEIDQTKKEKTIEIKNFQLPKFEVSIETDQDLSRPQTEISGRVLAKFFHGQAVVGATADVVLQAGEQKQIFHGTTNKEGILKFNILGINAPDNEKVNLTAEVTDSSQNKISSQKSATVSSNGIIVELFPEAGKLKPGIDNEILIVTSHSDGKPAKASVFMTGEKIREFSTNESGLAKFTYHPETGLRQSNFNLEVRDELGNVVNRVFTLENEEVRAGYILLRPDKTVYNDNALNIDVVATQDRPTYIEMLQDGLVIHSETLEIKNGKANKTLTIPEKAFGTIELRAMQILSSTGNDSKIPEIISDSRIIFIDRAKDLNVAITSDKESYLPGEDAKFNFQVTDTDNKPENSALGIKIVDEALLALGGDSENISKLIFLVDDKVRDYAVSLNGLTWEDILKNPNNELNNIILQAMLKNVPREKVKFGSLEKDNSGLWENFNEDRRNLSLFLLEMLIVILVICCVNFWWKITSYAKEKISNRRIWNTALVVSIFTVLVVTIFIQEKEYDSFFANMFYSIDLFSSFFKTVVSYPYFSLFMIALSACLTFLAWSQRQILNQYRKIVMPFFIVLFLLTLFAVIEISFGVSAYLGETLWLFISRLSLATITLGSLYFMILYNSEKNTNSVLNYLFIFLIGLFMVVLNQVMILLFVLFFIFALVRISGKKTDRSLEIEERIINLEKELMVDGKSKEKIELELLLLRKDLEESQVNSKIGLALTWLLVVIASMITFVIISNILISLFNSFSAPSYRPQHSYNEYVSDPREITVNLVKYTITIFGILSLLLIITGGIRRIFGLGNRARAKLMITAGIIGSILILIFYTVMNFVVQTASSRIDGSMIDYGGSSLMDVENPSGALNSSRAPDLGFNYAENVGLSTGNSDKSISITNPLDSLSWGDSKKTEQAKITENEITLNEGVDEKLQPAKRIRKFFPETMYWDAELIAENGQASLNIPMKDSITSWRLSALANSLSGKIGSKDKNIIVFQDFFIDFNIPFNLSEGDDFWLPITISNYLQTEQKIKLRLNESDYYNWVEGGQEMITMQAGEVRNVFIRLLLKKQGDFALRIEAQGTKMADAVEKTFSVSPFGKFVSQTILSEQLNEENLTVNALFPKDAIADTEKIIVKLYPNVFSEIVEGLEGMIKLPSGCFEQTSSSLYPNILILKYIKKSGKDSPEIRAKAEDYINQGIQRLLTYELEPGGFSYWGHEPIETILTAYGLMEFSEMRDATFVDEDLITRTKDYLLKQQNNDGSFELTGSHNGGFSGGDELAKNAYIIWALSEADPKNSMLAKSIKYLENNLDQLDQSPYALVLATNAFVNYNPGATYTQNALSRLKRLITRDEDNLAYIKLDRANYFGSYGQAGNIEITSLTAIALANSGDTESSDSLIKYITKRKSGNGSWGSTQATILALKALTENEIAKKTVKDNQGGLDIVLNNNTPTTLTINKDNSEAVQYLKLDHALTTNNEIKITKKGKISASLQITKEYFGAWNNNQTQNSSDLEIRQEFGITQDSQSVQDNNPDLKIGQKGKLYISIRSNNTQKNVVADIAIPAGFEIYSPTLSCQLVSNNYCNVYQFNKMKGLSRFEIKAGRVILYFDSLQANESSLYVIEFTPRNAGLFKVLPARLYAYYNPYNEAYSRPIEKIEVK